MEQEFVHDTSQQREKSLPGPWQWYVLLVTGIALTGFFPWLMVAYALYKRRKKHIASIAFFLNLVVFITFSLAILRVQVVWWWIISFTYLFNIIWALSAWIFQRQILGSAPKRYFLKEWKAWISPVIIGVVLGVCISTIFSGFSAAQNRMEMWRTGETLDRESVLWDFFDYSFLGAAGGLLLGLWWAGERKGFRTSHVITFLAALALTIFIWFLLGFLLVFLIHKGIDISARGYTCNTTDWNVIPPGVSGFRRYLLDFQTFDVSALFIVPLLFGAVSRIRDFGKRVLLIFMTFVCVLPMAFAGDEWWSSTQDQVLYDMSSHDQEIRAAAYEWAEILLTRFPNHSRWPQIAEEVARYSYKEGKYEESRTRYQQIRDRYSDSNQWYWTVARVRAALNSPDFGTPPAETILTIPVIDYESYLSNNWMVLLSVIRYWEGTDVAESELKIRLKDFSLDDNRISLHRLKDFATLDDAARNLGYEVLILPAELADAKALISAGIPIIHQAYTSFNLIFGFDESRSAVCAYIFDKLSTRLRREAPKEVKEILTLEEEGRGESQKRLARIANEAYHEYPKEYWSLASLKYTGSLMALVYPAEKGEAIEAALQTPLALLRQESDGLLAALIGLAYLNQADPVQAIEWAKISMEKTTDPLPLYVAHLANILWESRHKKLRNTLRLQDQFSELARIFEYFDAPENSEFLESARLRFEEDLQTQTLPWTISGSYLLLLDRSEPEEFTIITNILQNALSINPASKGYWSSLAETYEWTEDLPEMVNALKGEVSSDPSDSGAKLHLAYGHILLEQYAEAKSVLESIDVSKIKYDADYPFCLAAIAEWEGDVKEALKYYEIAVEMRRYKPVYFLRYGKLLLREEQKEKAKKALEWAKRIDAGEEIKKEAEKLLGEM